MIVDVLTLIATSALAFGAIKISLQANTISERAIRVEVDRHIFEWAQRCLNCASRISSLRMLPEDKISDDDFESARRMLYAEMFALKEEGTLFFDKSQTPTPCIKALETAISHVKHDVFLPPKTGDFEGRKATNTAIRKSIRKFSSIIQSRVGGRWGNN